MKDGQPLIQHVQRFVELDESAVLALQEAIEYREVKKRQFIVQPGFVCTHQTYVVSGVLRSYLLADGNEHTIQFAVDDWWISDFNSYIFQQPADLFVEAMENSQLLQLAHARAEDLCDRFPSIERFFRLVAQKAFAYSQRRVLANLQQSAEERYESFEHMYPTIVQRVPQYTLASYLGMSAEFLSKIRKRRMEKS